MIAILENIRSVYNVGSMFRTADGAGIEKMYLCGYTPTPLNKLDKPRKDMSKVALGATNYVDWEEADSAMEVVDKLQSKGFKVFCLEQDTSSISYNDVDCDNFDWDKSALVVGNEVNGVSDSLVRVSDEVIEIPMLGKKKSLNVSIAFGVVSFYLSLNCAQNK